MLPVHSTVPPASTRDCSIPGTTRLQPARLDWRRRTFKPDFSSKPTAPSRFTLPRNDLSCASFLVSSSSSTENPPMGSNSKTENVASTGPVETSASPPARRPSTSTLAAPSSRKPAFTLRPPLVSELRSSSSPVAVTARSFLLSLKLTLKPWTRKSGRGAAGLPLSVAVAPAGEGAFLNNSERFSFPSGPMETSARPPSTTTSSGLKLPRQSAPKSGTILIRGSSMMETGGILPSPPGRKIRRPLRSTPSEKSNSAEVISKGTSSFSCRSASTRDLTAEGRVASHRLMARTRKMTAHNPPNISVSLDLRSLGDNYWILLHWSSPASFLASTISGSDGRK